MAVERDPYKVIGVAPLAAESEIKKVYREKSKKYHPDLNPDVRLWADEKMKELVEAYNIISDPEQKKAYDMSFHHLYRKEKRRKKKGKDDKKGEKSLSDKINDFFANSSFFKVELPFGLGKKKPAKSKASKGKKKEKEVEYNPKEAEMNFGLGVSMCDNNNFLDQTLDLFKKTTQYDPEYLEAYYNLGIAYYRKGMWNESTANFQKVLKLDPADEGAKYFLNILKEDVF